MIIRVAFLTVGISVIILTAGIRGVFCLVVSTLSKTITIVGQIGICLWWLVIITANFVLIISQKIMDD